MIHLLLLGILGAAIYGWGVSLVIREKDRNFAGFLLGLGLAICAVDTAMSHRDSRASLDGSCPICLAVERPALGKCYMCEKPLCTNCQQRRRIGLKGPMRPLCPSCDEDLLELRRHHG